MYLRQFQTDFAGQIPAQRRAYDSSAEVVVTVIRIADGDGEVFWDMVKQNHQGMRFVDLCGCSENSILESGFVGGERKVLWIARTVELQGHFHQLFACKF